MENFLIKQEAYLEVGIHIGTKLRSIDMNQFIYRMRNDGLYVLDLRKIDERVRLAGKMLSKYEPSEVMVVASRTYSGNAAAVFSAMTGIMVYSGRFIPGILTNVARDDFVEPKLLLVCDPKGERQAVVEAGKMGISTIGLCDSDNITMFIDWVVPCNNKGRRSLALIFYLLTREYLMGRGKIASYDEFTKPLSAFEAEQGEEAGGGAAPEAKPQEGEQPSLAAADLTAVEQAVEAAEAAGAKAEEGKVERKPEEKKPQKEPEGEK